MARALETTEKKFQIHEIISMWLLLLFVQLSLSVANGGYFPLLPLINTNLLLSWQISGSVLHILVHLSFVAFGG